MHQPSLVGILIVLKCFNLITPHNFAQKIQDIFSTIHPYFLQNDFKVLGGRIMQNFPTEMKLSYYQEKEK